jgi:hypothetical protein
MSYRHVSYWHVLSDLPRDLVTQANHDRYGTLRTIVLGIVRRVPCVPWIACGALVRDMGLLGVGSYEDGVLRWRNAVNDAAFPLPLIITIRS